MSLRPVDRDTLADISISIARDNYGFLYVDRVSDELIDRYGSADTGMTKASTVSRSDIKAGLQEIAGRDDEGLERIRSGVYYYDLFKLGHDTKIPDALKDLFIAQQQVVTAEQIRNEFNLAVDDIGFFTDKLVDNDMLFSIAAGSREYYSVGSLLKEQTGQNKLDDELRVRSKQGEPIGILSHESLERIISVNATSDVIQYLERQLECIVDLDGEYLVWEAVDEFGVWAGEEIEAEVVDEFEQAGYAMARPTYREIVTAALESRTSVLQEVNRQQRETIVDAVVEGLETTCGITVDGEIAVHQEPLEAEIEAHADKVVRPILSETAAATPSVMKETATSEIDELHLADTEPANEYLRDQVRQRAETKIDEEF